MYAYDAGIMFVVTRKPAGYADAHRDGVRGVWEARKDIMYTGEKARGGLLSR